MKKRLAYIDLTKSLAIFMVITLHSGTWYTDFINSGRLINFFQFCIRLVCEPVPIFMLINGFLLFGKELSLTAHLRRTVRIFIIILCWSVIMDVYFCAVLNKPITLENVLTSVLNTSINNPHTNVLWFLQALVVVYLVFPVLKQVYDTNFNTFKYFLLILIVSTFTINLLSLGANYLPNNLLSNLMFFLKQYSITFTNNIYIIYFMTGGYLLRNYKTIPHTPFIIMGIISFILISIIGFTLSIHQSTTCSPNLNYSQIFLLFSIVGLFLFCSHIPLHNTLINKLLAIIGDNTMGIYLLHRMVIWLGNRIMPTNMLPFAGRLLFSLCVLLVSLAFSLIIRKIPKLSFLVKL